MLLSACILHMYICFLKQNLCKVCGVSIHKLMMNCGKGKIQTIQTLQKPPLLADRDKKGFAPLLLPCLPCHKYFLSARTAMRCLPVGLTKKKKKDWDSANRVTS